METWLLSDVCSAVDKLLIEVDTIGLSPEKVVTHHGDDYHPAWWVEMHPTIASERTSQNSRRWRKRDLGSAERAIPNH